jgi:hypothetical protein
MSPAADFIRHPVGRAFAIAMVLIPKGTGCGPKLSKSRSAG